MFEFNKELPLSAHEHDASLNGALASTRYIDASAPSIVAFSREVAGKGSPHDKAVRLYYGVRDYIRYDPYAVDMQPEGLSASRCLADGYGFCITKSVLLAAVARAAGIPARLGFADVRNHLATPRLIALMGTDIFYFHGYTSLYLDGRWVKATPAFNIELCEKFGVKPLEFDGREDSIFHAFDTSGRQHMEYVHDRGLFDDLPFDEIKTTFAQHYPKMSVGGAAASGDFQAEAQAQAKAPGH